VKTSDLWTRPGVALSLGLLLSALLVQSAWAQAAYRCTGDSGRAIWSDKPCDPGRLTHYGPVVASPPPQQQQPSPPTSRQSPPAAQNSLSGECRGLTDRFQNAVNNSANLEVLRGLADQWQSRCVGGEADEPVRRRDQAQQLGDNARNDSTKKDEERRLQEAAKAQQQEHLDQCAELKRIQRNKRERTNLTPGERGDLARFEENYKNRCGG
jgi:hypothetical protein